MVKLNEHTEITVNSIVHVNIRSAIVAHDKVQDPGVNKAPPILCIYVLRISINTFKTQAPGLDRYIAILLNDTFAILFFLCFLLSFILLTIYITHLISLFAFPIITITTNQLELHSTFYQPACNDDATKIGRYTNKEEDLGKEIHHGRRNTFSTQTTPGSLSYNLKTIGLDSI
jgi:hypothetical protein